MDPLVETQRSNKGSEGVGTICDEALVVGFPLIQNTKSGVAPKGVCQILYFRQRVAIRDSLFIQEAIVNAQTQATVLLPDRQLGQNMGTWT